MLDKLRNLVIITPMQIDKEKNRQTAEFIRERREKLRLTQQQLGDYIGVPRYNIAKYESGATRPPGDVVLKIAELTQGL